MMRSRLDGRRNRRRMPAGRGASKRVIGSPLLEECVYGGDVVLPPGDLAAQCLSSPGRQRVVACATIVLGEAPFGAHVAGVFEAMERFVEGRVDDAELAAGALVDPFAEREPVQGSGRQRAEHEQVERAV